MIKFTRMPLAAAILLCLVVTYGCDSNSNVASVVGASDTDIDSDGEGVGTVDETTSENSDNTSGTEGGDTGTTETETETEAENETGSETDPAEEVPVSIDNTEYEAMYTVRFDAIWSEQTHPINFPAANPHFSPLTGAVHSEQVVLWERGQNASDGIEDMAETGGTGVLLSEIQAAIDEGYALSSIQGGGISLSPGATSVEFLVNRDYPLVTLVSMLAPSPDWFIGINSLPLIDSNGDFIESITIELNLYDSGTDGGVRFTSADQDIPRSPIALVNSFPSDSDFIEGQPSVGSLVFTKMP